MSKISGLFQFSNARYGTPPQTPPKATTFIHGAEEVKDQRQAMTHTTPTASTRKRRTSKNPRTAKKKSDHISVDLSFTFNQQQQQGKLFQSVISKPLPMWNEMEDAVQDYAPQWSPSQRSKLISCTVQFLELKICLQDYSQHDGLLFPTVLIARTWYAISIRESLYSWLTRWIQDFHETDHKTVYRPPLSLHTTTSKTTDRADVVEEEKNDAEHLERTQRLFLCYYQETMPLSLKAIDRWTQSQHNVDHVQVEEQDSDSEGSDFEDDVDDEADMDGLGNEEQHEIASVCSAHSVTWADKLASYMTCWADPFPDAKTNGQNSGKGDVRRKISQSKTKTEDSPSSWLKKFFPAPQNSMTTTPMTEESDPQQQRPQQQRRANAVDEVIAGGEEFTDDEASDGDSTIWIHFKTQPQDDEMTFLTMDFDEEGNFRPSARHHRATISTAKENSQAEARQNPSLPAKLDAGRLRKEGKQGWELLKTKFRIAAMLLKELE